MAHGLRGGERPGLRRPRRAPAALRPRQAGPAVTATGGAGGPRRRPADVREAAVGAPRRDRRPRRRRGVVAGLRPRQRAGRPRRLAGRSGSRATELVGMRGFRHRDFGLADLLRPQDLDELRPAPGQRLAREPAQRTGRRRCGRPCGPGSTWSRRATTRAAMLVLGGDPERGHGAAAVHAGRRPSRRGRRSRRADPRARRRAQRVPRAGDLVRQRHVRRARPLLQFHRRPRGDRRRRDPARRRRWRRSAARWSGSPSTASGCSPPGQHLKRGLLLYGPPGVGKTHTVRYLVGPADRHDDRRAHRRRAAA